MFYILSEDFSLPSAKKVTYPANMLRINYFLGKEIALETPNIKVEISNKKTFLQDSIVNFDKLFFFNSKLIEIIAKNSQDPIQVCPIDIITKKPNDSKAVYKLVIPLTTLNCIDKVKSDIIYSQNDVIIGINHLLLDLKQVVDHDLFRIKDYPALTVVSEKLASIFIAEKISGIKLIPVDKFKI